MRRSLITAILLIATAVTPTAQAVRNVPRISIDELKRLLDAGTVLVIDVRRPDEYAAGHIPGAVNLDYTQVPAHGSRFTGESRTIVTYCACSNEMTAARAAVDLAAAGVTGAKALKGGWDEWKARGEPVEK